MGTLLEKSKVSIKVNRIEFLTLLEAIEPGTSARDHIEQSTSVILRKGYGITYNGEVMGRVKTNLPPEWTAAVHAKTLINVFRTLEEDEVECDLIGTILHVRGKRRKIKIVAETDIISPVSEIEKPAGWNELPEDFCPAVRMVGECTGKDKKQQYVYTCVHIHPEYIEASNNRQICRFNCDMSALTEAALVRRDPIVHIVNQDVTHFAETATWLHFLAPNGLILSVLRSQEVFPDFTQHLQFRGVKTALPKNLISATALAEIFSGEDTENSSVEIALKPGFLRIMGEGAHGSASEITKVKYDGPEIAFRVGPKILAGIVEKHNAAEVGNHNQFGIDVMKLKVDGGKWVFITNMSDATKRNKSDDAE